MKSIRHIAEKYGGTITVDAKDEIFTLQVLIPLEMHGSFFYIRLSLFALKRWDSLFFVSGFLIEKMSISYYNETSAQVISNRFLQTGMQK